MLHPPNPSSAFPANDPAAIRHSGTTPERGLGNVPPGRQGGQDVLPERAIDDPLRTPVSRKLLLAAAPRLLSGEDPQASHLTGVQAFQLKKYVDECAAAEMLDEEPPIMPKLLQLLPEAHIVPWQKGVAPNPKGRPKGSRHKLSMKFFTDLHDIWLEQGDGILRRAAFQDPMGFAAMCAKLMPQKIEVRDTTLEDMEDDKLANLISALEQRLTSGHSAGGRDAGTGGRSVKTIEGRVIEQGEPRPAGALPPVSETD